MRVLFLSASTGGGHTKAAEAVMEQLHSKYPHCECLIVDVLKYINPFLEKIISGTYLRTIKNMPKLYGRFYRLADKYEGITKMTLGINALLAPGLLKLIEQFAPSIIVCSHTFPVHMLSSLKLKGKTSIPIIAVVTDFTSHMFWKLKGIDAFVVAHQCVKNDMIRMGIPKNKIYIFGIPISNKFLQKKERQMLEKELGLQNKPTILIMGGSLGLGKVEKAFQTLLESEKDFQILVVTGQNAKLEKRLRVMSAQSIKKIIILGYTNLIPELMEVSDAIITKPGGITISESLIKQLPIFLISPIPGQEEKNAKFLSDIGAASFIKYTSETEKILNSVLENPEKVNNMRSIGKSIAKPYAAESTASLIRSIIEQKIIN